MNASPSPSPATPSRRRPTSRAPPPPSRSSTSPGWMTQLPLLPNLATSSTGSCSPLESRQYNLRRKQKHTSCEASDDYYFQMSTNRTNWTEPVTKNFLDLCLVEKRLGNYNSYGLSSIGWQHVYQQFPWLSGEMFTHKQLQNKFTSLKQSYFNWRDLDNHTGLGRDPGSGDVAADPTFWEHLEGEPSGSNGHRGKEPPYLEELHELFRHMVRDSGKLISAGGLRDAKPTPSEQTPPSMAQDTNPNGSGAILGKRAPREEAVDSPRKRRSNSVEDILQGISESVQERRHSRGTHDTEEVDIVLKLLHEDGIEQGSELHLKALFLIRNSINRKVFTSLSTREARVAWINFNWDNRD